MSSTPLQNYTHQLTPPIDSGDVKRCTNRETPDLLKINCKNFQENQIVDTSITDPVISRSDYCRFSLDRGRGILHSNSKIQLAVTSTGNADDGKVFFPMGSGILANIDRAVLRSGTTVIQEIRDAGHYYTAKGLLDTNEDVKNRYSVTEGRSNAFENVTDVINVAGVITTGSEFSSEMFVDNGLENTETYTPNPAKAQNEVTNHNHLMRNVQILNNGSEFVVSLADLFPCLRQFSLPLFLTEEPIIIELFFNTNSTQTASFSDSVAAPADVYTIDSTKTKLIADYITYSEEIMSEFAEKNKTMALNFTDPQLVKSNNNYNTVSNYTTSLGGSGKIIDDVLISHSELDSVDLKKSLLNAFQSDDITQNLAGSQMAVNLRVNDRQLFPVDVTNISEQYQNSVLAEGMPYNLCADEYCRSAFGQPLSERFTIEGYGSGTLSGEKRYFAIRNSRVEERVSNNGIDLIIRATNPVNTEAVVRAYVGVRKSLVFRGGRFFVIDL